MPTSLYPKAPALLQTVRDGGARMAVTGDAKIAMQRLLDGGFVRLLPALHRSAPGFEVTSKGLAYLSEHIKADVRP
jgi:hypothetical protein